MFFPVFFFLIESALRIEQQCQNVGYGHIQGYLIILQRTFKRDNVNQFCSYLDQGHTLSTLHKHTYIFKHLKIKLETFQVLFLFPFSPTVVAFTRWGHTTEEQQFQQGCFGDLLSRPLLLLPISLGKREKRRTIDAASAYFPKHNFPFEFTWKQHF